MHDSTLAKRYASALAELADEAGELEKVGGDLGRFVELIDMTPGLDALLTSPVADRADQHRILDLFFEQNKGTKVVGKFLRLLVDKRRISLIHHIVDLYNKGMAERSGRITVQISSARSLLKKQEEKLQASLSEMTGKDVQLDLSTDEALLGGMVVRVGSVMMDYSVRCQLNRLKSQMRG
ncbi:MAG: ATP synthase F1 subunit delta [Magnetococcales bacterium]|nr:ATP synthase F1 subunit delta [Magnetococcales bacterium]